MNDETGLTKMSEPQSQGLAPRAASDDDGQQVLALAIAQPAHPKKPDDLKAGQFFLPLTGEGVGDKIMLIAVAQFFTRAYWRKQAQGQEPDKEPLCASLDGLYPKTGESPPQAADGRVVDNCADCVFSKWTNDAIDKKKRLPPLCSRSINYLAIVQGADKVDRVVRIGFKRTGYRVGQDIEQVTRSALPPRPLWGTVFEIRLSEVKKPQQRYFVPQMRVLGQTAQKAGPMLKEAERIFSTWSPTKAARVAREAFDEEIDGAQSDDDGGATSSPTEPRSGAAPAATASGEKPATDDLPF